VHAANRRHLLLVIAGACLLPSSGAAAVAANEFAASLTPTAVKPSTSATYEIKLVNSAASGMEADRAKIAIAPNFVVAAESVRASTSATPDCAAAEWVADGDLITENKINLKWPGGGNPNTRLCQGATLTITFSATSAPAEGSYTWATQLLRGETDFSLTGEAPSVSVDGTAPTVSIGQRPSSPSNSRSATFSFAVGELLGALCKLDNAPFAPCGSPVAYDNLADGPHTFAVAATDAAGNTGQDSYNWTVETKAPAAAVSSGPAALSNSRSATFAFSADEPSSFQCQLDGGSFLPCSSPSSYQGLGDGAHTFAVKAIDAAGNASTSSAYGWRIDATAPATTLGSRPRSGTTTVSAIFTFSANEPVRFECKLDAATFTPCVSPKSYAGLRRSTHSFEVHAIDAAGNVDATGAVHRWTIAAPRRARTTSALLAPRAGARVTSPPLLVWRRVRRASFYNVQLYRGRVKVLSSWPTRPRLQLRARWTYLGRQRKLTAGTYRWFVWPASGANRYGRLLGQSTFRVAAPRP
jgi:hypothetical protein